MRRKFGLTPLIGFILGVVILSGCEPPQLGVSDAGVSASPSASPSVSPSPEEPTPSPSPSATTEECPAEYVQVEVGHDGNKVLDEFSADYAKATAEADNLSKAQKDVLLEWTGKSGFILSIWTHPFGLYEDPSEWEELVDGECLSAEGIALHNQLEGAFTAKVAKFEEAEAPTNGYNSGVDDGVYGIASEPGIYGDRKAIMITMDDGSKVYILIRCGNVVYPGKPDLPEVPTDNPPPTKKVCIWNPKLPPDHPDCLERKVWAETPQNEGWRPAGTNHETDGRETTRQRESGDVRGHVDKDPVDTGTKSDDTTKDVKKDSVTAGGATPNDGSTGKEVEDTSDDEVEDNAVHDEGGTNGATCVPTTDPFTGKATNCD